MYIYIYISVAILAQGVTIGFNDFWMRFFGPANPLVPLAKPSCRSGAKAEEPAGSSNSSNIGLGELVSRVPSTCSSVYRERSGGATADSRTNRRRRCGATRAVAKPRT